MKRAGNGEEEGEEDGPFPGEKREDALGDLPKRACLLSQSECEEDAGDDVEEPADGRNGLRFQVETTVVFSVSKASSRAGHQWQVYIHSLSLWERVG